MFLGLSCVRVLVFLCVVCLCGCVCVCIVCVFVSVCLYVGAIKMKAECSICLSENCLYEDLLLPLARRSSSSLSVPGLRGV